MCSPAKLKKCSYSFVYFCCLGEPYNTHIHTNVNIFHRKSAGSPKWEVQTLWWILHDVSESGFQHWLQTNNSHLWFLLPLTPTAYSLNITHTEVGEAYQLALMLLSSLPTALLHPIIIDDLFNPEEGDRSNWLSFDLLSLNVKWLWLLLPAFLPTQTGTHTQQPTRPLTQTYYYSLGQTCWPRHQLLWIGLTKSGADPLSKAWENP